MVGDSFTDYVVPAEQTSLPLTSTTAGNTSIVMTNSPDTGRVAPGDIIELCTLNCATSEYVTVANSWGGPGNTTIPITGTVANTGETYFSVYSARMPFVGLLTASQSYGAYSWGDLALARLGQPLVYATGPRKQASGYPSRSTPGPAVYGESGANSDQVLGLASYTDLLGITTTQNWLTYALQSNANYVHILIGANDITSNFTAAHTEANITTMINAVIASGKVPIVGTIAPRSDPLTSNLCTSTARTAAQYAFQAQVNSWIRHLHTVYPNKIIVVDYNQGLADPKSPINWASSGTPGNASVGGNYNIPVGVSYSRDCVHPTTWDGAWMMASKLDDALQSAGISGTLQKTSGEILNMSGTLPPAATANSALNADLNYSATFGSNPRGNFITNGGMSNASASCTPSGGSAGQCPDSWSVGVIRTPASGSITWSVVAKGNTPGDPFDRGYWAQVNIAQGTGTDWGEVDYTQFDVASLASQTPSANTWQVGDLITAQATIKIIDGCYAPNQKYASFGNLQIQFKNAGSVVISQPYNNYTWAPDSPTDPSSCPSYVVLKMLPVAIPANTKNILLRVYLQGVGTFQVGNVEVRKVF